LKQHAEYDPPEMAGSPEYAAIMAGTNFMWE
jgi:hypothetical protein